LTEHNFFFLLSEFLIFLANKFILNQTPPGNHTTYLVPTKHFLERYELVLCGIVDDQDADDGSTPDWLALSGMVRFG